MTIGPVPLCQTCKRLIKPWACEAFPKGIPLDIMVWMHDHHDPFPGDGGKLYVPTHKEHALPDAERGEPAHDGTTKPK